MPPKNDPEILALRAELEDLYKNLKVTFSFNSANIHICLFYLGSPAETSGCYS